MNKQTSKNTNLQNNRPRGNQSIDTQLDKLQTCDLGRVFSLNKTIASKKRKGQPVEQLAKKLEELLHRSQQNTKNIADKIPKIQIAADLPIAEKSEQLIELLQNNQVIIVAGETGCGKTTQLPKICLQAGLGIRGKIAHTQPRRVAATSVASRIASEVNSPLGELVGYSVRFSDKTSQNTRIKLMTDGILLSELQSDPMLRNYEVIIIDEAHERSLNIDFLLGFLKQLLCKRKELKVIVTSATIDPQSFSNYFNDAPIMLVEGRTYPVEVRYQPIEEVDDASGSDPLLSSIRDAVDSCMLESTGDILIFSHGESEIKNVSKYLKQQNLKQTEILPLYARLGIKEQQSIFSSSNNRKIIIATNVAETSLTIPNIVFVIDIGTARISRYSQRNKIQQLPVEKISQASAEQRKGRCGRICPGICIRLYSQQDFELRSEYTLAEIKRTNLSSVVLRLKAMKVSQVESFPFIQSPDDRQWKVAFNLLYELGAMDDAKAITKIGQRMAHLPLDPQLARILLDDNLTATEEMLIVASFLSVRDVRMRPHDKQQKADQLHARYSDPNSDVLSIIKLWNFLDKQRNELSSSAFRRWCQKNLINFVGWLEWRNIYFQTKENIGAFGIKVGTQSASADDIHKALICGFISHIMIKTQERFYQGARGIKVWLHPSSVMFKQSSSWLLSTEMIETDKLYARSNAPIKPEWIEQIAPHLIKNNYQDIHWRKNKGQTAAFLSQTLLGLPIVNRRLVDYSDVDIGGARELFLLEGLACDNINQNFPFLDKNRQILRDIEDEEKRLRASDIKITEQELASLYEKQIPAKINNLISLKRWLKKDWKARNQFLTFDSGRLSQRPAESIQDYPSEISIGGVSLPLSYSFAPGESEDGVTVEIPSAMLQQFKQSDFDWLVPGYLSEKITTVMKALPKSVRKSFIPLAETAKKCADEILTLDYLSMPFKPTLVKTIKKITGVDIAIEDIDLDKIPAHLQMKFRSGISGKKSRSIANQLSQLQQHQSSSQTSESQEKNAPAHNLSTKLYSWPEVDFSLEEINQVAGRDIRIFRGLCDRGEFVELKEYSSLTEAQESHSFGVARLVILDQLRLIKEIKNSWPDRKEIEKLNLRFGGFSPLLDWLVLSLLINMQASQSDAITSKKQYLSMTHEFSKSGRAMIAEGLTQLLRLLRQKNQLYAHMAKLKSDVFSNSMEDIKQQLVSLWSSRRFIQQGNNLYPTYHRYLQGIESRLTRINENFPKEQSALDIWQDWNDWWNELSQQSGDAEFKSQLDELFWNLQEYRISLFATNIKTRNSISAKKLQKLFDRLEERLVL